MFREAVAAGTELGRTVEPLLRDGVLVPDEVTVALIRDRLSQSDARDGFVLDGFPRTVPQAEALDEMLASEGRGLDAILFFDLPDEVGMARALKRAESENRADDTPEVIATRLATYHAETEPIVEHYRVTGKLVPLHADRTIEGVWSEISTALRHLSEVA
jgi:adenylate kinase